MLFSLQMCDTNCERLKTWPVRKQCADCDVNFDKRIEWAKVFPCLYHVLQLNRTIVQKQTVGNNQHFDKYIIIISGSSKRQQFGNFDTYTCISAREYQFTN